MPFLAQIHIPFKDPIIIFTILISLILIVPLLSKKLRVPGIIGLIVSGIIIGPHGLNILQLDDSIKLLSSIGLLYLMFLVGLELDIRQVKRHKNKSILFGILTFIIPLVIAFVMTYYILNYSFLASMLIASMFSTHTLIAYPIASKLGITRSEVVTFVIGGTIITDTGALLMLAFISSAAQGELTLLFWVKMIASLALLSFAVLWGIPKIFKWFFKHNENESGLHFIFVLCILFLSGVFAHVLGIEPIIGTFLAGMALSSLIPHTSALMNRVSFVGNNLFIPIFLVGVGLMVDLKVFTQGSTAIIFAGTLVVVAITSKYIAAWIMQLIYKYTVFERHVIFGLSVSHAAAIIAVVVVGYNLKLIGLDILNGAIMIILVSCMIASFVTEKAGKKLALKEAEKLPDSIHQFDNVLVPIANPNTLENLIDFALLICKTNKKQPVYMLSVVKDNEFAKENIRKNNKIYESAISHAASVDMDLQLISRVDLNIANGINKAIKELMINKTVIGWNGKNSTSNFIFGSIIQNVISNTEEMVLVVKSIRSFNTTERIIVYFPEYSEHESGFEEVLDSIAMLSIRLSANILFTGNQATFKNIKKYLGKRLDNLQPMFEEFISSRAVAEQSKIVKENDLYVILNARPGTISYKNYFQSYPRDLEKYHENNNFVVIYPDQKNSLSKSTTIETLDLSSFRDVEKNKDINYSVEDFY